MGASSKSRSVDYRVEVVISNIGTDFEEHCEYTSPDMNLHCIVSCEKGAMTEYSDDCDVMSHTLS